MDAPLEIAVLVTLLVILAKKLRKFYIEFEESD